MGQMTFPSFPRPSAQRRSLPPVCLRLNFRSRSRRPAVIRGYPIRVDVLIEGANHARDELPCSCIRDVGKTLSRVGRFYYVYPLSALDSRNSPHSPPSMCYGWNRDTRLTLCRQGGWEDETALNLVPEVSRWPLRKYPFALLSAQCPVSVAYDL